MITLQDNNKRKVEVVGNPTMEIHRDKVRTNNPNNTNRTDPRVTVTITPQHVRLKAFLITYYRKLT